MIQFLLSQKQEKRGDLSLSGMQKQFTQIAFDFGAPPEAPVNRAAAATAPTPPKNPMKEVAAAPDPVPEPTDRQAAEDIQQPELATQHETELPVVETGHEMDLPLSAAEEEPELPVTDTAEEPIDELPTEIPVPTAESATQTLTRKKGSTRGRRSLRDNAIRADLIDVPADEELFSKSYYPIGEVARMFGENQSLIRYWESEFDLLKPRKNKKGDRYFRPVDIKNLVLIHDLLRRRKFTIEGAREYLKKNKKAEEKFAMIQSLEKIKAFFLELKAQL